MVEKFQTTEALSGKLNIFPDPGNAELFYGVFAICLAVQWWAAYYPGAEPGGGGYLVQRMLAAKDEKHAVGATLFFNFAHYALRPWPWIIVALCSLLVFPELQDIKEAFPAIPDAKLRHDVAYSAMIMKTVPNGWLGLIMASLIAAYMSTISTHLNWGSCYIVHDLLPRFKPDATNREKVWTGRISTVVLMVITAFVAMYLKSSKEAFDLVILVGAGTGLLFILRWFWWRINAWCEIVAMVVSFSLAMILKTEAVNGVIMQLAGETMVGPARIIVGVSGTTIAWLITAFVTRPTDTTTLRDFCRLTNPSGPGWKKVFSEAEAEGQAIVPEHAQDNLPMGILYTVLGSLAVYGVLFAAGEWIYGNIVQAIGFTAMAVVSSVALFILWKRVK